ncbi:MAG TPA: CD225/dispanin family protein [Pyrinomonadaceae bacterium]|nr:CD225/dispanin family protein [Pyrinomonadaceae bacterium]
MSQPYPPPTAASGASATVPNYLIPAIVATILCCLPTGVVSIIFSTQVNGKIAAGDMAGAEAASKKAKLWLYISIGAGVLLWVIIIILNIGVLLAALSGNR